MLKPRKTSLFSPEVRARWAKPQYKAFRNVESKVAIAIKEWILEVHDFVNKKCTSLEIYCGDRDEDKEAARAFGCDFVEPEQFCDFVRWGSIKY